MYHRYVKVPIEHRKPSCFSHEPSQSEVIFVPKKDLDQSVIDWIESFDVIVSNVTEGIYTPPNQGKVHIHNDTSTITNATKINFTWGPNTSTTRWWQVKDESLLKIDITDSSHITEVVNPDIVDHFDNNNKHSELICESEQDCDMVCEKVINQPINVENNINTITLVTNFILIINCSLLNLEKTRFIMLNNLLIHTKIKAPIKK